MTTPPWVILWCVGGCNEEAGSHAHPDLERCVHGPDATRVAMAPTKKASSQPSASQKKPKPSSSRSRTVKLDGNLPSSSTLKRIDPLTAVSCTSSKAFSKKYLGNNRGSSRSILHLFQHRPRQAADLPVQHMIARASRKKAIRLFLSPLVCIRFLKSLFLE